MNVMTMRPKRKVSLHRENAKNIIRAYRAEYGVYPSVKEAIELSGFSRIVIEPSLDVVIAEEGNKSEVKINKRQLALVDARIKVLSKKLEDEFNERVRLTMLEKNKEYRNGLEKLQKEAKENIELYTKLINRHKPLFTEDQFRTIIACLHPDNSASTEKRETAFRLFQTMKTQLTGKK